MSWKYENGFLFVHNIIHMHAHLDSQNNLYDAEVYLIFVDIRIIHLRDYNLFG